MTMLYIAPGHGVRPDGVFDPGATCDGLVEHTLNVRIMIAMVAALGRSGFHDFHYELGGGENKDPNYSGSVRAANRLGAKYALEIHTNSGGGSGSEALFYAPGGHGQQWAGQIVSEFHRYMGLPRRGTAARPHLAFLRGTTGHAVISEWAFIDGDHDWIATHQALRCRQAGEALARATLDQLNRPYKDCW